jgi:hypothetical protein
MQAPSRAAKGKIKHARMSFSVTLNLLQGLFFHPSASFAGMDAETSSA